MRAPFMTARTLGHRAPLLWLVLPFIAGIVTGRYGPVGNPRALLACALVAAFAALFAAGRSLRCWAWLLVTAVVLAGDASYTLRRGRLVVWAQLPPREARLTLRVDRIFPQAAGLATIVRGEPHTAELVGQRLYFALALRKGESPPIRSTVISTVGVLKPLPENPPAATFDGYLADAGMNFRLARGRLLAVEVPPTRHRMFCEHLARRLNAILSAGVAAKRPDLAAVYRAMMLGQKHELSAEQDELFMHSGTMHLFAINGLHIAVVATAIHALLLLARCPRPAVASLTLLILWLDVDTTGASPSAVRAWLLVAAYEFSFLLRLPANGVAALATAALVVLLKEPMALFSASFQMSYGVVFAILCFGLPLSERLATSLPPWPNLPEVTWTWWQRWCAVAVRWFWPVFGIGVAAWLVGSITGAAFYAVFTPGGLVANLVLVPLAMLVIISGFASIGAGLAGLATASLLFNHAALLVLVVMDFLIRLGQRVPGVWWAAQWRVSWVGTMTLTILLGTILAGYAFNWQGWSRWFWPPFAVVTLALIFGVKFG